MKLISPLEQLPKLQQSDLRNLASSGHLRWLKSGFCYLDIDDRYLDYGFELIEDKHAVKPDYHSDKYHAMGAHIILYPEEKSLTPAFELFDQYFEFSLADWICIDIRQHRYYALRVKSPSLLALRASWGLGPQLTFYDKQVDLHITVGKRSRNNRA